MAHLENTTHNSLQVVSGAFSDVWKARERRDLIDRRIASLEKVSNGNDRHAGRIATLKFERVEVVKRIALLSSRATGYANATARRLGA